MQLQFRFAALTPVAVAASAGPAALAAAMLVAGCSPSNPGCFQGYIEGEFVYAGSALGGTLTGLAVERGAEVKAGQLLFELERESELAAVREAEERLAQARARLENLAKGKRPTEITALEAQLQQARANLQLSELELARAVNLREDDIIAPEELDRARARRDTDRAQADTLAADLETARLGAREDEFNAAEADVKALEAALEKARWSLGQKSQASPADATVHDTLYRPGEWVAPGNPVVALLPPTNIKVRFFVPQTELSAIRPGQVVSASVDGAPHPYTATVNYISTRAEFTPPVIYSRENRAKLVFMIEATFAPADAAELRPGQPVDVRISR